jgi:hypothetical protein
VSPIRLLFALCLAIWPVARAAAEPACSDAIASLTPDEARTVVAGSEGEELVISVCPVTIDDFPIGVALGNGHGAVRATRSQGLSLNGLTTLDADAARGLATSPCLRLHLGGLAVSIGGEIAGMAETGAGNVFEEGGSGSGWPRRYPAGMPTPSPCTPSISSPRQPGG